jgi:hypothetical protein
MLTLHPLKLSDREVATCFLYLEGNVTLYVYIYGSTALVDLDRFFSFLIYTQSVGLLGRGISQSQGRYLHEEQHKHRRNAHTDTHVSSGLRTHDPSVRADEGSSFLIPRGHCDYLSVTQFLDIVT